MHCNISAHMKIPYCIHDMYFHKHKMDDALSVDICVVNELLIKIQ